jgi:16S rRNA (uracil1498-N3)-methyltransferase
LRYFFVAPENIFSSQVTIDEEQTRHIEKVLRLKIGEEVQVFDGCGREYTVVLRAKEGRCLIGAIIDRQTAVPPQVRVTLVQGIAKGDKMDTIIQKAVEVGCSAIIPVTTKYTVVQLEKDRAVQKVARWQAIAREACKQSRRSVVPEVKPVVRYNQLFSQLKGNTIILYENEDHVSLRTVVQQMKSSSPEAGAVNLLIGPEGGFSEDEVNLARQYGAQSAGLGKYILRTETAGLVAASIVLYEYGEIG